MIEIGTAIDSQAILWVASVATVMQIAMWLLVFVAHVRAVVKKNILWPGKGKQIAALLFLDCYQMLSRSVLFGSNNRPLFLLPCSINLCLLPPITKADSTLYADEDHDA